MIQSLRRFARLAIVLMLALLPSLISPPGSHAQARTGGQKPEGLSIHHDGVVHVKELPPPSQEALTDKVRPRRFPDHDLLRQIKEERRLEGLERQQAPEFLLPFESVQGPSIPTSFLGLRRSESGGFIPPDTQIAAGPDHLFEAVNTEGRILNKDGSAAPTPFDVPFSLNAFFGLSPSAFTTDPKIRFDPASGRWFVLIVTDEDTRGTWRLAVSTSSDPTDPFVLYSFATPGRFADFPALGINDDKVILTGNAFACTTICGNTFLGTMFIVLNKANLVAGVTVASDLFPPPQGLNTIQPAHSLSSTTTLFMGAVNFPSATSIRIWSVTGIPGVGGGVAMSTVDKTIATLSSPPNALQMGTSRRIATNDNSLLDAIFRDGSLWVSATSACQPSGDTLTRSCLRFIEILTATLTVNQDFDFGTNGTYYYYPAIQTDSANNLLTVFSRSSASEFASVYASGRLTTDTLNTLQAPVLIKAGEASYGADRWGDYSGAGIDPSDQASVWVASEYARVEGGSEWGTAIAKFQLGVPGLGLRVLKSGNGSGMVTSTPAALNCDSNCIGSLVRFNSNTPVTLTVVPDADALFFGWSGDLDCSDGMVTITADMTCTATFIKAPDLTGQIISLIKTAGNGKDKLQFTLLVQNVGTAPVTGSFVVQLFLSDNSQLDVGDKLLLTKTVKAKNLPPGGAVSISGKATVPSPSSGKWLLGLIDTTNVIAELDEGNNLAALKIP